MNADRIDRAASELATALGGAANIARVGHCVTRLRLELRDRAAVDERALRDHPAVLGVRDVDTFQVIVGPAVVADLARALSRLVEV